MCWTWSGRESSKSRVHTSLGSIDVETGEERVLAISEKLLWIKKIERVGMSGRWTHRKVFTGEKVRRTFDGVHWMKFGMSTCNPLICLMQRFAKLSDFINENDGDELNQGLVLSFLFFLEAKQDLGNNRSGFTMQPLCPFWWTWQWQREEERGWAQQKLRPRPTAGSRLFEG